MQPRRWLAADASGETTTTTTTLEVWTWGRGEAGQLGLGRESTERSPSLLEFLPHAFRLAPMPGALPTNPGSSPQSAAQVGIACGLFHSCLWKNGELWLWGKGDGGRLGTGSEASLYSPRLNPFLSRVHSVALGGLHSAAITESGDVLTFGFGGFGALGHGTYENVLEPKLVDGSAVGMSSIVHIACGGAHTAAVSASGSVFTWGRDEGEGRLGYIPGPRYEDGTCVPEQVRGIPDSTAAVACGGFFTMALTSAGQLWSWGGNSNYELGTGDRRASWRPRVVPEVESTRLTQVACGGYHSAALTEDGKVLTWGHGGHGQLGHGDLANTKTPKVVEALEGQRAVSVACGGAWTTAVTESGDLYTWGKNRDCQLGVSGLMDTEMLPIRVDLAAEPDQAPDSSRRAIAVASGAHHGMCLVLRT